jgi:Zn-finger nucleic acid-binding protein
MICPHCNCILETVVDSDLPTHHCPCCSGTWISGRALHAMLARSNDSASIEKIFNSLIDLDFRESRRLCPSCANRKLKVVVIDRTELDFCSSCKGVFFDPGEVESVLPAIGGVATKPGQAAKQSGFWSSLKRLLDRN